jgi:hypothetical protein
VKTLSKPSVQSDFEYRDLDPLLRLKAQFCQAALQGHIATQNANGAGFIHEVDYIIEHAYRLGELMFEKFAEENPSIIRRFNRKVGIS